MLTFPSLQSAYATTNVNKISSYAYSRMRARAHTHTHTHTQAQQLHLPETDLFALMLFRGAFEQRSSCGVK
jgi:hypothetical protein